MASQPRVHGLALQGEDDEDSLVHPPQRLAPDKPLQTLDAEAELAKGERPLVAQPPAAPARQVAEKKEPPLRPISSGDVFMKTQQLYWLFAVATTAWTSCAVVPLRAADPEVRIEHDMPFLGEGRSEKLDLYLPAKVNQGHRFPGVIIIHGGGFTGGTKRGAREQNIGTTLAKNGYVCISIDYLLAVKDKPARPQNLHDCKTAVRWLQANADKYHVDPDHIGVIGGSAGGHLALMVGLTDPDAGLDPKEPYGKFSCRVQAVVDLYGPGDLVSRGKDHVMFPATLADKPEIYRQASPVTHASKGDPPVLILHGTGDKTVPVEQSRRMAEALKKAGVEHELILVEGAPHSFHLEPKEKDLRPTVIGFFDKHLKSR